MALSTLRREHVAAFCDKCGKEFKAPTSLPRHHRISLTCGAAKLNSAEVSVSKFVNVGGDSVLPAKRKSACALHTYLLRNSAFLYDRWLSRCPHVLPTGSEVESDGEDANYELHLPFAADVTMEDLKAMQDVASFFKFDIKGKETVRVEINDPPRSSYTMTGTARFLAKRGTPHPR